MLTKKMDSYSPASMSLQEWAKVTSQQLQDIFSSLFYDLSKGKSMFEIYSAVPNVNNLEDGEFVLALVSGTLKLYTRVGGSLYHIDFTAG